MTQLDVASIDHVLKTTRAVRKRLDLDRPVEPEVLIECLDIALQAPTGSNAQGWQWLIVTDADKKAKIGEYYKTSWTDYSSQRPSSPSPGAKANPDQMRRVISSARYLAENMGNVPVLVIPCIRGRMEKSSVANQAGLYGSIIPAIWSFMLALRARGLGTSYTTLHLVYEKEVAELLGIPDDYTQAALIPIGYFTGDDFAPAERIPASQLTHWEAWGNKQG